ncbi:hypothetical protein DMH17_03115 [Raoultella planticola]|nr:hypothetical protein [Raoultella planticola]
MFCASIQPGSSPPYALHRRRYHRPGKERVLPHLFHHLSGIKIGADGYPRGIGKIFGSSAGAIP